MKPPSGLAGDFNNAYYPFMLSRPGDPPQAADWQQKEYSIEDLRFLDSIKSPNYVLDMSMAKNKGLAFDDPNYGYGCTVVYANKTMVNLYGPTRPQSDTDAIFEYFSDEKKCMFWSFLKLFDELHSEATIFTSPYKLLHSMFLGVKETDPQQSFHGRVIRMKLQPGEPASPCMYITIGTSDPDLARAAAVQHHSPMQTFVFDCQGELIMANCSALTKYPPGADGRKVTLLELFKEGIYAGGEEEATEACSNALKIIFQERQEVSRHVQTRPSTHDPRETRHIMFEMWPFTDPVTNQLSMLVSLNNVTEQKRLEMELQDHRDSLARANQDLAAENMSLENQNLMIEQQKAELAANLAKVMAKTMPMPHIDAETPLDKVLKLLDNAILGRSFDIDAVLEAKMLLSSSQDLRAPMRLEQQLLAVNSVDAEVGLAMMQMLQTKRAVAPIRQEGELPMPGRHSVQHGASRAGRKALLSFSQKKLLSTTSLPSAPAGNLASLTVPHALSGQLERSLQSAGHSWQYDSFALQAEAPEHPLSVMAFHLLTASGLVKHFRLNEIKLARFLNRIEAGYPDNPYHNRLHAMEVFQKMHMLLQHAGLLRHGVCDDLGALAGYLAAAVHDYEHRGVTNDYLVRSRDALAVTYNEQSPMEHHHLAAAFRLLQKPKYNFMEGMRAEDQATLRTAVIQQVLATDMKAHFNTVSRFQTVFTPKQPASREASRRSTGEVERRAGGGAGHRKTLSGCPRAAAAVDWEGLSEEDKMVARKMALKCADLGHLSAAPEAHRRWAANLEEELFRQGDLERQAGMAISPLMDRTSPKGGVTRSQVGFFSIVGVPMLQSFVDIFECAAPLLEGTMANLRMWETEAAASKAS
ncbi:hypothetical protein WJX72_002875 [[Myrmecia] bisecta]|uniref:Phosphodiesterase n=1 Tax=[Myrmecia] bisecta TaxID=41462 RepID=A0AAW1NZY2_9CHLO